jgi:hypothetical protein
MAEHNCGEKASRRADERFQVRGAMRSGEKGVEMAKKIGEKSEVLKRRFCID